MSEAPASPRETVRSVMSRTPFLVAMGVEMLHMGDCVATARLPYAAQLVGDPDRGVLHGGAITTLLDHLGGGAAASALGEEPVAVATLDLRIDYMKPASPGLDLFAEMRCLRVSREIAFVRGAAYHVDPADPVATCTAAFMIIRGDVPPAVKTA